MSPAFVMLQVIQLRAAVLLLPLIACDSVEPAPPQPSSQAPPNTALATVERPSTLEIGHTLGAEDAPVTVTEFSDFGCEACAEFARESLPALKREFVATGKVRWRFVPIRQGFYRGGDAATAAECAAEQDLFWEMHDRLLARQREWQSRGDPMETFAGYALEIGGDPEAFTACYTSDRPAETLRLHDLVTLTLGIRAVPMFMVGGQRIIGALEPERFADVLRRHIAGKLEEAPNRE